MSRVIEIIDSESEDDNAPSISSSVSNIIDATNDGQKSQSRRRPRKSLLQSLPDPDVQFETIAVDDDNDIHTNPKEDNIPAKSDSLLRPLHQRMSKTTPKILAPKPPSNAEAITYAFEEYMTRPDAKECIETIAHERPEVLKFQFDERLKQQKMMQIWGANKVQENRGRSIMQNSSEQETS